MAGLLENLVIGRAKKFYKGQVNPWELPEWQPTVEGVKTTGARNLEDLSGALRKTDVTGPAAGTILENANEGTQGNILNLATTFGNDIGGKGLAAEQGQQDREQRNAESLRQFYLGKKGIKAQRDIARSGQMTQVASSGSNSCCFIFIEGNALTDNVRTLRDQLFPKGSEVEMGYRKMARWLVPKMRMNRFVKQLTIVFMLAPICKIADHFYGENSYGWVFRPIGHFWKKVWERMGK